MHTRKGPFQWFTKIICTQPVLTVPSITYWNSCWNQGSDSECRKRSYTSSSVLWSTQHGLSEMWLFVLKSLCNLAVESLKLYTREIYLVIKLLHGKKLTVGFHCVWFNHWMWSRILVHWCRLCKRSTIVTDELWGVSIGAAGLWS